MTTEISKEEKPDNLDENKTVAKRGGKVAGNARKDAEKEFGVSEYPIKLVMTIYEFRRQQ
ncbi:MAG: hypothetical protein JKY80_03430 [Mariprofundaceae bacterium]|nr:hypothetical protein [Mariprofundaceae bacterium]